MADHLKTIFFIPLILDPKWNHRYVNHIGLTYILTWILFTNHRKYSLNRVTNVV